MSLPKILKILKTKINRENIVLVGILIVLIAIPLTVVLLGIRQELRKKAVGVSGAILINSGAETTNSREVTLTLTAPAKVFFPADHVQHPAFKSEWWYLNLLTRTNKSGGSVIKDLGYVVSFSRIAGNNGLLTSRYDNSTKAFQQATQTGGQLSGVLESGLMKVSYLGTNANMILRELVPSRNGAKQYTLTGTTPQVGTFDLTLKERTVGSVGYNTPLLWGCTGNISVFAPNDTFYYSVPDLDISGTITDVNGERRVVLGGKAWMDHQWFNSTPSSNWKGHYWTSFHYTKSTSVHDPGSHAGVGFVTQVYNSGPKYTYWVKRNFDGTNACGTGGEVKVNAYGSNGYPVDWTFDFTSWGLAKPRAGAFSEKQVFTVGNVSFFEPAAYFNGITETGYTGLGFLETSIKK